MLGRLVSARTCGARTRCARLSSYATLVWVTALFIAAVPAHAAPVARDDTFSVAANSSRNELDVLDNDDTGATGRNALSIVDVGTPDAGGTIEIHKDRTLRYTPAPGFVGTETVDYTITDSSRLTSSATATIIVGPPPAPPPPAEPPSALEVDLVVAPQPVLVDAPAVWTVTITNVGIDSIDSVMLNGSFTSDSSLSFDPPSNAGCTLTPTTHGANLACSLGRLGDGESHVLEIIGTASRRGDVTGAAIASIAGRDAQDPDAGTDAASVVLSVTNELSEGPVTQVAGIDVRALTAGDFDGDTFSDIALATGADRPVLVLFNRPDPANGLKRVLADSPLALGYAALDNGIEAADLDGDGDLDLTVAAGTGFANRVFLNDGNGRFQVNELEVADDDSRAVAAGDVDGDGLVDLVFANAGVNRVYLGLGGGRFAAPTALLGGASRHVLLADVTGDTVPELVFSSDDADAQIHGHDGGGFQRLVSLPTGPATQAAQADFNNDGALDLVFGRASGNAPANLVFLNASTVPPGFTLAASLGAAPTLAIATADTNLTEGSDIVVLTAMGVIQIYLSSSAGQFSLHPQQLKNDAARSVVTMQFSGDQRPDLGIAGAQGLSVYLNDGRGNFGLGDRASPEITLLGAAQMSLSVGQTFVDPGATAMDGVDGDLSTAIVVDNPVDTSLIGDYVVSYNVADSAGNLADTVTRTVHVAAREAAFADDGGAGAFGGVALLALCLAWWVSRRQRRYASVHTSRDCQETRCASVQTRWRAMGRLFPFVGDRPRGNR